MTQSALYSIFQLGVQAGTARTMESLGVSSGEISQRKALKVYGKRFTDMIRDGRLNPCHVETGKTGTHWYKVTDILAVMASEEAQAALL